MTIVLKGVGNLIPQQPRHRIASTFTALKTQGRKALIPFVTAGYPYADITPELMHAMVAGGADSTISALGIGGFAAARTRAGEGQGATDGVRE